MAFKSTPIAVLVAAAGLAASSASFAQATKPADAGFYIGGSVGEASGDCNATAQTSCDDKDTAWKIFGGYQLNRNFAVELGYSDLGEVSSSGPFGTKVESTLWDLVAVGSLPLGNNFSLYGKLGAYRAEAELSSNVGVSGDKKTTDLTYGLGARYDFTRNLAVRAEWQRYQGIEVPNTVLTSGDSDADVLNIGVLWKF
jgi:OOP family OmpA-OmpF porin